MNISDRWQLRLMALLLSMLLWLVLHYQRPAPKPVWHRGQARKVSAPKPKPKPKAVLPPPSVQEPLP